MIAPDLGPSSRRIFTTGDAHRLARKRLPRLVFDFLEGGVGREVALRDNCSAFDRIKLQPRALENVAERSLETTLLGRTWSLPFGIAPMGMCNLTHPEADVAMARLAQAARIPVGLSTAASTSLEDFAGMAGDTAWFQLYVGQSQDGGLEMAARACEAGFETLILTVDAPQVSRRARDMHNGFQVPFRIGPRQFIDFAVHPFWSVPMLRHTLAQGRPAPANFDIAAGKGFNRDEPRAGADWSFLSRLRDFWPGTLIVKGLTNTADALRVRDCGVDVLWLSNHGGRQLDSVAPAIDFLSVIRDAVGPSTPLIFDSGVRSGDDVVKALALGADFVMLGRAWTYALGADGPRGLISLARLLAEEVSTTMAQIGTTRIEQIDRSVLASASLPGDTGTQTSPKLRQAT